MVQWQLFGLFDDTYTSDCSWAAIRSYCWSYLKAENKKSLYKWQLYLAAKLAYVADKDRSGFILKGFWDERGFMT